MTFKIGDKVNVYLDPFTVSDLEEPGIIKSTPEPTGDNDIKGRPMFRCAIRFGDEWTRYHRTISEPISH